jgi:SAM-dependent methyltransferase
MSPALPPGAKLLEVAIGTGFPFAVELSERGFALSGIDIAPILVLECQRRLPSADVRIGRAEMLEFSDQSFDAVYCFHSTWQFEDLASAIAEMIRVTKPGGHIFFDIENLRNARMAAAFAEQLAARRFSARLKRYYYSALMLLKGTPGPIRWRPPISEQPTDPRMVYGLLNQHAPTAARLYGRDDSQRLVPLELNLDHPQSERLIFWLTI